MSIRRIAFIDDHPTLLRGIVAIFAEDPLYEICGTGKNANDILLVLERSSPEIMIVDLSMDGDVFAAIQAAVEAAPKVKIIVFTAFADVTMALRALDAGAHGFVLKGRPSEELLDAIDAVLAGELFISASFAPKLVTGFRNRARQLKTVPHLKLSARENQIVQCLFEAMSNKQIARELHLTEKTVKHYMTNLMTKLNVKSRLEVVLASKHLQSADGGQHFNGEAN